MNDLLLTSEDPSTVSLKPYVKQDPETEVVRPRYLQLVPGRLALILIHRRRVRAKHALPGTLKSHTSGRWHGGVQ